MESDISKKIGEAKAILPICENGTLELLVMDCMKVASRAISSLICMRPYYHGT